MGLGHSPLVVTDSLEVYIDAANLRSYPGSGTVCSDISAKGRTHNLVGSTSLTTIDGVTCFNVSASGSYLQNVGSTFTFGAAHTLVVWGRALADSQVSDWRTLWRTTPNDHPIIIQDATNLIGYWDSDTLSFNSYGLNLGTLGLENKWAMYTVVASGGTSTLYINDGTVSGSVAFSTVGNSHVNLGSTGTTGGGAQPFGYVASASIYSRALSVAEIKRLYNATKKRYTIDPVLQTYYPYSPIPTSGLVMHVDAGNPLSYSGSGSTWTDIQGNYNLTLANSPTHSPSTNGGIFTFNGSNQNAKNSSINFATGTSTVIGSARLTGAANQRTISSVNNNWLLGTWGGYVDRYFAEGWVNQNVTVDTNWKIYAGTSNTAADNFKLYSNGVKLADNNLGSAGPNGISLGSYGNNTEYSACQIGFLLVYNRVLSDAEITQVYDHFKSRYGLS